MRAAVMLDELAVDRAAIFTDVCRRNALRREAHLPRLDLRAEYERLVAVETWRLICEGHYTRTRAEVLAEKRAQHGPDWGLSAGGRWAVEIFTAQRLCERYRC